METISTDRLTLRPVRPDDLPFFIQLHADPLVARTLGDGRPRTEETTRTWFSLLARSYEVHGVGQLAVCRRDDGGLLGRCGLTIYEIEQDPEPAGLTEHSLRGFWGPGAAGALPHTRELEIGYVIAPPSWGNGYATEAARAIRDHAFRSSTVDRLVSVILLGNVGSERVAQKLSMTRRARNYVLGDRPVSLYELRRDGAGVGDEPIAAPTGTHIPPFR